MVKKRVVLFIISFSLIFALIYTVDINAFLEVASRISFFWFCSLLAVQLLILYIMAVRWYVIIRRYGVSFKNVLQTSFIGLMVNCLTPMSVAGGEPIRAYVISKIDSIKMEKAFATVFVELFISLIPSLLINMVALILVFKHSFDIRIAWLLAIVGLVIIALFSTSIGILTRREHSLKLFNWILTQFGRINFLKNHVKFIESKVDELFSSFQRSIRATLMDGWNLSLGLIISTLIWLLSFLRIYMIFLAVGVDIDLEILFIVYAVLTTVSILPLLPGALGMWEWVGTGLFAYFGIPLEVAAAIVIIDRVFFYWLPIGLGVLASINVGLKVSTLMEQQDAI